MNTGVTSAKLREICIRLSYEKESAHLASALSSADIVSVLFQEYLDYEVDSKSFANNNRFILSKGHAASCLYAALFLKKIISQAQLNSYTEKHSIFEEHPNPKIPSVDFPTGALGHGLPLACGLALGNRLRCSKGFIYVLMSDGECNEGTVWEAAQFAHSKALNNIITIIDHNKFQATGPTTETFGNISLAKLFEAFGWEVTEIDGHSFEEIRMAIDKAHISTKPTAIIAHTIKGKGISFMEGDNNWHYKSPSSTEVSRATQELMTK